MSQSKNEFLGNDYQIVKKVRTLECDWEELLDSEYETRKFNLLLNRTIILSNKCFERLIE